MISKKFSVIFAV